MKLDVFKVTFTLSEPVCVENTLDGKKSRHLTHFAPEFHRSIRSPSPAPVEFIKVSCLHTTDTFKAWPESDTEESLLSKSRRFKIWPFKKLLPATPDTVSTGCRPSSRLFVAACVYDSDVSRSWPDVASERERAPATCKRFNSLPVLSVNPVTSASNKDAELSLIKLLTSAFVNASTVSKMVPELSDMATTPSLPAVARRRTVVPSRKGMEPLPDALVRISCLPASSVVSVDVKV